MLNSIQDTIITYDFGDRKETIDFEKIKDKFINKDYELSSKKSKNILKSWQKNMILSELRENLSRLMTEPPVSQVVITDGR